MVIVWDSSLELRVIEHSRDEERKIYDLLFPFLGMIFTSKFARRVNRGR